MPSLPDNKSKVALILGAAMILGLATIQVAPILTKNVKFLAVLPFAAMIFFIMVLSVHTMFTLIIFSRDFLDPLLEGTRIGGGGGIGGLLNIFVIAMVFFMIAKRPSGVKGNRYLLAWGLFLLMGAFTVLYSPMRGLSAKLLLNLMTYPAMFVVPFYIVNRTEDKKYWIKLILIASLVPMALANLGVVYKHPLLYAWDRLKSTFTHSNILAFYCMFLVVTLMTVLRTKLFRLSPMIRLFLWLYMADVLAVMVVTQTRSAWFSCAIFFLLYGIMKERKFLMICLLGGALLLALPPVQQRLQDLKEGTGVRTNEKLNSMAWRMQLWQSAVPEIQKRFFTGHGLGSFEHLSGNFFKKEKKGVPAHSVYVELVFETGIFGVLAFLAVFLTLLKTFFRRYRSLAEDLSRESTMMFAYLVGYLAVCYSDNVLYYLAFNWYFWFFLGVVIRSGDLAKQTAA